LQWEQLGACAANAILNDLQGIMDGRKHSLGDFLEGAAGGCLVGAASTIIPDAAGLLDGLEAGDASAAGIDGAEDLSATADDLSGEGTADDSLGQDSCTTAEANSFPGSTPVTMANGSTEPISKLKPGDYVQATDLATGKTTAEPVLAVIKGHKNEQFARITIAVGDGKNRRTGVIVATTGHLFYDVTRHDWVAAGSLHLRDQLDLLHGVSAIIAEIQVFDQSEATAYNLTVGADHDYYVSPMGTGVALLVHNANCGETPATIRGKAQHKNWAPGVGWEKEFKIPGDGKVDGINWNLRQIIELKPNNSRQIRLGWRQVERYIDELDRLYPGTPWQGKVVTY
jgi:hypothetical protein